MSLKNENGKHITMEMWEKAGCFENVAVPGDTVDDDIVDAFLNAVPPASHMKTYVQCGEPYSHEPVEGDTGKFAPTYATFAKDAGCDEWVYCGECFKRETINRRKM